MRCMSEVAARCCLKWRGSEWVSCWKSAVAKLQKIGCFVNISSEDLQKADPEPFSPRLPRDRGDWGGQNWLTNKSFLYFFLAFSFPFKKWYSIWSPFNDPGRVKLHIPNTYCWGWFSLIPEHTEGIKDNYRKVSVLQRK